MKKRVIAIFGRVTAIACGHARAQVVAFLGGAAQRSARAAGGMAAEGVPKLLVFLHRADACVARLASCARRTAPPQRGAHTTGQRIADFSAGHPSSGLSGIKWIHRPACVGIRVRVPSESAARHEQSPAPSSTGGTCARFSTLRVVAPTLSPTSRSVVGVVLLAPSRAVLRRPRREASDPRARHVTTEQLAAGGLSKTAVEKAMAA